MSNYQANIITKNPATPTGPNANGSAPGIWRMDEVAYWVKQGLWPNAANVNDPYFPYVSMLLSTTALGNASNNLFVDSSGAFNLISRNGNTAQGSATPYSANWSNYFNGTNSRMSIADNAAFGFGTGNFTVEFWLYYTGGNGYKFFFVNNSGSGNYVGYGLNNGTLTPWVWNNGNVLVASSDITPNTWQHHALVRNGSTLTIYLNGTAIGSTTWATDIGSSRPFYIGWNGGGDTQSPSGYFSNFRVVKGTAVYTSNFTPPTSALTAISGTSLLTCQSNRFRDASTNNFTVTVSGGVNTTDFAPFSPGSPGITYNQSDITNWSGWFDNTRSGNLLSWSFSGSPVQNAVAGTNYTIEFWVYRLPRTNTYQCMFSTENDRNNIIIDGSNNLSVASNGGTIMFSGIAANTYLPLRQWTHLALVCSGTTWTLYFNGTSYGTYNGASKSNYGSGSAALGGRGDMDGCGYMSNFRVSTSARYSGNFTPSTTAFTSDANTAMLTLQSAAFSDNSSNAQILQISTSGSNGTNISGNSPFVPGYWSNYFDGSGDSLSGASWSSAGNFGTGDFTVEGWFYAVSAPQGNNVIWSCNIYPNSTGLYLRYFGGASTELDVRYGNTAIVTASAGWSFNQWHHVAVVRSSGTLTLYINGVSRGSASFTNNCTDGLQYIGRPNDTSNYAFHGYVSNFRIVKGTAVYTSAFTVPTTPLTAITNTSLLTCQNGRFIDNSTNAYAITANGETSAQSFNPFYTATIASNGGSMYFDGSGDYLTSPSSPNYALGTGDFIVEVWVNPSVQGGHGSSNNDCIIDFRPGSNGAYGTLYSFNSGASINWVVSGAIRITGGAIPNNAWSHLMVSRVSGSTRLFINGVQSGSTYADSTDYLQAPVWLGQFNDGVGSGWFQGYMSGARIVKGTGVSSTFTPPTAPQTPTAATTLLVNGMNAGIYDATAVNDMETVGNAQVSTTVSKFGGSSVYFDGNGDWLVMPANPAMALGSAAFTIEAWVYPTTLSGTKPIIECRSSGASATGYAFLVNSTGNLNVYTNGGFLGASSTALTANVWSHVALVRTGTGSNQTTYYINGTAAGTITMSGSFTDANTNVTRIGGSTSAGEVWVGYIDDLRVTNGIARYTGNFTPPTATFIPY